MCCNLEKNDMNYASTDESDVGTVCSSPISVTHLHCHHLCIIQPSQRHLAGLLGASSSLAAS